MKTIVINKMVIKLYDSADEMPIKNFQKYNKYLLIDSGIGSDADDIDSHITRVAKYINIGDTKKALRELQNMRQNLYMVNCQISPKHLAFAALIATIDGEAVTDLSDDNLKAILERINTVKQSALVEMLMNIKKKICSELELYFPQCFVDAREKERFDRFRKRLLLMLDDIVYDTDSQEQIEEIDNWFYAMSNPMVFAGDNSAEIQYDKQFESSCLLIAQKTNLNAKDMTVLQFYNALDVIKKQIEAESKSIKPHNR